MFNTVNYPNITFLVSLAMCVTLGIALRTRRFFDVMTGCYYRVPA